MTSSEKLQDLAEELQDLSKTIEAGKPFDEKRLVAALDEASTVVGVEAMRTSMDEMTLSEETQTAPFDEASHS